MRAFTDLFTNRVNQDILPLPEALTSLARTDALPRHFLPTALHEYTHHWCNSLPVGIALGAVRGRIERGLAEIEDLKNDPAMPELLNLWYRYAVAVKLLDPIMEGLACFAEFESVPGPSESVSGLYEQIFRMFRPEDPLPSDLRGLGSEPSAAQIAWFVGAWRREIGSIRRSDEWVWRKQNLCYRPLLDDTDSAYLLGSLMLNTFQRRAAARAPAFTDTEFFLGFAAQTFYRDFQLASLMLEHGPDVDFHEWWERLLGHILARARCFDSADLEDRAVTYEEALRAGPSEEQTLRIASATVGSPESFSEYRRRLVKDYHVLPGDEELALAAGSIDMLAFRRELVRPLLRVSSGRFQAMPSGDGVNVNLGDLTVTVSRPEYVDVQMLDGGSIPVQATLTFDPRGGDDDPAWLLSVSTLDGRLIGKHVFSRAEHLDSTNQALWERQMHFLAFLDARDEDAPVSFRPLVDEFEGYAVAELQDAYAALAAQALELEPQAAEHYMESMSHLGLVGLLDGDASFAGELVLLSVGRGSGLDGTDLAAWLDAQGVDLEGLIARAKRWQIGHGLALVHTLPTGEVTCAF